MSQKSDIEQMLEAGKGYDEIEDSTGSKRTYIRSIAVGYRKTTGEGNTEEEEGTEPETHTKKPEQKSGMNFLDDKPPEVKTEGTSGADQHKAWVKAAKYECGSCGATIGKSESFCPHCGETLMWEGVE